MATGVRSARGRLLGRGQRRRDREPADLGLEFSGIQASPGGEPVARGELKVATTRPLGQDAEQVAEVGLGVETVEPGGGDEREQVAGGLGVVVAADEEPRLSAGRHPPQLALGLVVGKRQSAVVEEAGECRPLTMGVAEGRAEQTALVLDPLVLLADPGEERVGMRSEVKLAEFLAFGRSLLPPRSLEVEDPLDPQEAFARDRVLGRDRCLPDLAPTMALIWRSR
jgi:hypothetical protein